MTASQLSGAPEQFSGLGRLQTFTINGWTSGTYSNLYGPLAPQHEGPLTNPNLYATVAPWNVGPLTYMNSYVTMAPLNDVGTMTYTSVGATVHSDIKAINMFAAPVTAETEIEPRSPGEIESAVALNNALAELHDLDPGWLDGEGELISRLAIAKAKNRLGAWLSKGAAPPSVFPTPEGGVQAQWSSENLLMTITFKPDGAVRLYAKNRVTREVTRITLEPAQVAEPAPTVCDGPR